MQNKIIPLFVLIFALVLRVISLNQSLWLDEATSVLVARNFSFGEILSKFSPGDFHPPLYYLILRAWIIVFGSTEIAVRSLSVILGTATVLLVYLLAKKYLTRKVAILASLFMATAPLHIYYSQEARMYALAAFLVSLSVWFFLKIIDNSKNVFLWVGFTLTNILLIYTEYPAAFLLASYLAFLFFNKKLGLIFNRWIISITAVALLFLPWIPTMFFQLNTGLLAEVNTPTWWEVLGRVNAKEAMLIPIKFTIGRISSYNKDFYFLAASLILSVFGFLLLKSFKEWKKINFFWFWLVTPIFLAALFGIKLSIFKYFRLIFVLPAFYILLASGVDAIRKNVKIMFIIFILLVNLASSFVYLINPRFHREDWREAVSWIESNSRGNSAAMFVTKNQQDPYFYYSKNVPAFGPEGLLHGPFDTLWLVRYVQPIFDPQDKLRAQIESSGYVKREERDFNGVTIWQYEQTKNIFSSL